MNSQNKKSEPYEKDRNPAEYLVLGALDGGPLHGYDLYQYLEEHLGRIWTLGRSQTYALLSRMEQAGLVAHKRLSQEKRPDRKNFSLTPAGKKLYTHWVKAPEDHIRDLRLAFLSKIYFLEKKNRKSAEKLIQAQQTVCRDKLSRLEDRTKSAGSLMEQLTCDFRQSQARAALDWLEGLQKKMEKE